MKGDYIILTGMLHKMNMRIIIKHFVAFMKVDW